jgi:hypothetical protein
MPRLLMSGYDYRPALDPIDDDVLLIEWDLAIGKEDLIEFARRCKADPDRVLVAPYRLYHASSNRERPKPVWVHRRYERQGESLRHVTPEDDTCHLWGLGLTYLPRDIIRAFLDAGDWTLSDGALSGWHYRHVREDVPITWDIRPVHLHYQIPPIR